MSIELVQIANFMINLKLVDNPTLGIASCSHALPTCKCGSNMLARMSHHEMRISSVLWVRWQLRCDALQSEDTPRILERIVSTRNALIESTMGQYIGIKSLLNSTFDTSKLHWPITQCSSKCNSQDLSHVSIFYGHMIE